MVKSCIIQYVLTLNWYDNLSINKKTGNEQLHDYCERSSFRQIVILRSRPEPAATLTQSLLNSEECLSWNAASINFRVER